MNDAPTEPETSNAEQLWGTDPKEACARAFVAALGELANPGRDSSATIQTKQGGSFSYQYAGLDAILSDVRPVLARHGLAVSQPVAATADGLVTVRTRVLHERGVAIEGDPIARVVEGGPQEMGSFVTYARRYELCSLLGIHPAGEDDDGAQAQPARRGNGSQRAKPPEEPTGPADVNVGGLKLSQRTDEELRELAEAPPSARIGALAKAHLEQRALEAAAPQATLPDAEPEGTQVDASGEEG